MSYQVLARKWRPKNFKELVGQQHVLQALANALEQNRLHHAYLFTGTRGVGKTTIARILAKCLNCEQGVGSEPCGECSSCREIADGRFVDLIEVDAASRTKVEDTRELLDNVQYAPTRGRFKVYLIDEVHMLSNHSFNALLKTLEEPPPHVKFLLATTDPKKLPVTILSRCLQFHLKNMEPERVVEHLRHVLTEEGVGFDDAALWQLGRAAAGSMRDALSLTDQAIGFGGGDLSGENVQAMLGSIDQSLIAELADNLAAGDASALLNNVGQLAAFGPDYAGVLGELLSFLHRASIAQVLPDAVDNSGGDRDAVIALAKRVSAEDLQLFYQVALLGRRDLPLAFDPRSGFEMVLLRMLAFRPQGVHSVPTQSLSDDASAAAAESDTPMEPPPVKKPEPDPRPAATAEPTASELAAGPDLTGLAADPIDPAFHHGGQGTGLDPDQMAALGLRSARQIESPTPKPGASDANAVRESGQTKPSATEIPPPGSPGELTADNWHGLYKALGLSGILQATASSCTVLSAAAERIHMMLDANNSSLYDASQQQRLADALSAYFNTQLDVVIDVGEVQAETPAARMARLRREQLAAARQALDEDPLVQGLLQNFSGELDPESIQVGKPND